MVLKVKAKLPNATVSISRAGKVTSLEKWKIDWFHEVSELFSVTTDQVAHVANTKPTLEKTRAIESKARLTTVLSLIEGYLRSKLTLKKNCSNQNNNCNAPESRDAFQHPSSFSPWTMVDPNEVCPVDFIQRSKQKPKEVFDVEEALELLAGDQLPEDLFSGSESDTENSSDGEDKTLRSEINGAAQTDLPSSVALPAGECKKVSAEMAALEIIRERKRKRCEVDQDLAVNKATACTNVMYDSNGRVTHLLIPVSRQNSFGSGDVRARAQQKQQAATVKLPGVGVLLKQATGQREPGIPHISLRGPKPRSVSVDARAASCPVIKYGCKGLPKLQRIETFKSADLSKANRIRSVSTHHEPKVDANPNSCNFLSDKAPDFEFYDDIFSFCSSDDVVLTQDDLNMTPSELQMQSLSLFNSDKENIKQVDEENLELLADGKGKKILEASDLQNKPTQKRRYTKQPKPVKPIDDGNDFPKPPLPYNQLIYLSFKHNNFHHLTVRQMYSFIRNTFPYYKTAQQTWQNAVRHQLCCCKDYTKILLPPESPLDKGGKCAWKISDNKSLLKLQEDMVTHLEKDDVMEGIKSAIADDEEFTNCFGENSLSNTKKLELPADSEWA